ncbi:hypothetical protein QBC35DRAFT_466010 [Podospora australis]|uniref:Uncharacterized protein n=1 Tax=Podospora australis TaxID=1536484 RepID=A0AAN6WRE4_9PEZI|nr:hypothetical protein QBC35DRAFT_466010 [Podospora australis]
MVKLDKSTEFEILNLNMHTVHTKLVLDPTVHAIKTLTVLYRYGSDAVENVQLLNTPQFAPQVTVTITPSAAAAESEKTWKRLCGLPRLFVGVIKTEKLWRDSQGTVEIIAVLFGTERIESPSVLEELGRFLGGDPGQRKQIMTTSKFFETKAIRPYVPMARTVCFRLLDGSAARQATVRCVTGMQDGALEVPWMDQSLLFPESEVEVRS